MRYVLQVEIEAEDGAEASDAAELIRTSVAGPWVRDIHVYVEVAGT